MCSRFLAKHSAFRRAANDVNHEQMSFRPTHATSVVAQSFSRRPPTFDCGCIGATNQPDFPHDDVVLTVVWVRSTHVIENLIAEIPRRL
jgi:hypothetical protein